MWGNIVLNKLRSYLKKSKINVVVYFLKFLYNFFKIVWFFLINFYIHLIGFFLIFFNFINFFFKNYFSEVFFEFFYLLKSKWIFIFIVLLPVVSFAVWFQLIFYIFWFIYFFVIFLTYYTISSLLIIQIKEVSFNGEYPFWNFLYQFFIFTTKCKTFSVFYFFVNFLFKKKIKFNQTQFIGLLIFLLLFFIKYTFFMVLGFSYLTFITTVMITSKIKNGFRFSAENLNARYTNIFINICGWYSLSVCIALNLKITIVSREKIIFNPQKFEDFIKIIKNLDDPKLFFKLLESVKYFDVSFVKERSSNNKAHYSIIESFTDLKGKTNLLKVNATSSKDILVKKSFVLDEYFWLDLGYGFKPNVVGQSTFNYVTPVHFTSSDLIYKQFHQSYNFHWSKFQLASKFIIDNTHPIYDSNGNNLVLNENNVNVLELSKKFTFSNSVFWDTNIEFYLSNKTFLESTEGKQMITEVIYFISQSNIPLDDLFSNNSI